MGVKYYSNEHFFETWSPTMAYILGYIYADGSLENASYLRGKYLRVSSTDKELINFVKSLLQSDHSIVKLKPTNDLHKIRYLLRIGSYKIFNDLVKLGLHPNKSLTMKFPIIPKNFLPHFVRGYFDGDGYIGIEKLDGKFKKLNLVFTCGSKKFLTELAKLLYTVLDLKIIRIYDSHRSYRLAYSTSDSVKIFRYIYQDSNNLFLNRKFQVFKNFFLEYNKWVDNEVLRTINN